VTSEFIKKAIQEAVELTGGPTNRIKLVLFTVQHQPEPGGS
jgi:hypothetical protein